MKRLCLLIFTVFSFALAQFDANAHNPIPLQMEGVMRDVLQGEMMETTFVTYVSEYGRRSELYREGEEPIIGIEVIEDGAVVDRWVNIDFDYGNNEVKIENVTLPDCASFGRWCRLLGHEDVIGRRTEKWSYVSFERYAVQPWQPVMQGIFWIDVETGHVLKSELKISNGDAIMTEVTKLEFGPQAADLFIIPEAQP